MFFQAFNSFANERYWVFFTDKNGVSFEPYSYFDSKTIHKRLKLGIPLFEYTDLPVREDYIQAIQQISGEIHLISRWLNAVSINAGKNNLEKFESCPFVEKILPVSMVAIKTKSKPFKKEISFSLDYLRKKQLDAMGISFFEEAGLDGKGVRIAIFDGGFPGVDKSPVFTHLFENNQIVATWDFVKNREFVYAYNSHGTSVLTCIAGKLGDKKFGMAINAEFLLARTEIAREVFSEEENWLAAMEWADKNGADIINSSLGYTHHRYYQKQMDGHSTLVSRAASIAASKGMLVINAAGNDGNDFWKVIGAPADADSILSVGGVNPGNGYKINFSSIGPTFDGRLKPNICAFGEVTTSDNNKIKKAYGTSFATPLVAGFAACVMQMHPEWNNMKAYKEIQKSGHLYPYFDYAHGYGVPQAAYFTGRKTEIKPTFYFSEENDSIKIVFNPANNNQLNDTIDTKRATKEKPESDALNSPDTLEIKERYNIDDLYLYFHIEKVNTNLLKRYAVVRIMPGTKEFSLSKSEINRSTLRVFYRGYSREYVLKNNNESDNTWKTNENY